MRVGLIAVVLALSLQAGAEPLAGPCKDDIAKLCPSAVRREEVGACLEQHQAALSPGCAQVAAMKSRGGPGMRACAADVQKLCKDVQRGGGRVEACLKEHQAELSPECKAAAGETMGRVEAMRAVQTACKDDEAKLCKGVPHEGGKLMECMRAHKADVSPACSKAWENAQSQMHARPGPGMGTPQK